MVLRQKVARLLKGRDIVFFADFEISFYYFEYVTTMILKAISEHLDVSHVSVFVEKVKPPSRR
jgi:hypothetical protein